MQNQNNSAKVASGDGTQPDAKVGASQIYRKIRKKEPTTWVHTDGEFGGTTYYYVMPRSRKVYYQYIPNYYDDPATYGEVSIPEQLLEEWPIELDVKGINGSCIAGGMHGAHLHIISRTCDYCTLVENIAYIGE